MKQDFKGRNLLSKPLNPGSPGVSEGAGAVQAVLLVDPNGAPMVLAGSTVELDPAGPYTKHVDEVAGVLYIGEAVPGTSGASPAWRVSKVTTVGDDISKTWASGTARFTQVWDNRLSLTYS